MSKPAGPRAALAAFSALLVYGVLYRVRLGLMLGDTFASEVPRPLLSLLRQGAADAMLALFFGAGVLFFAQLLQLVLRPQRARLVRLCELCGLFFVGFLLLQIGVLCQGHHGTFFATGNGLTAQLLQESLSYEAIKELLFVMTPGEAAFMLLPTALFGLLYTLFSRVTWRPGLRAMVPLPRYAAGPFLALLSLVLFALIVPAAPLPESLLHHPIGFVALDVWRSRQHRLELAIDGAGLGAGLHEARAEQRGAPGDATSAAELADRPDDSGDTPTLPAALGKDPGMPTMALLSPEFVLPGSPEQEAVAAPLAKLEGGAAYNIVFVLMESTGLEYALRPLPGGGDRMAMPFLRSLADKGLLLSNHYSSGNSSPRGIFSLLSGLYVMPEVPIYDVRKDVYLPSLASYLGDKFHRFLVTPASLDWYFPHSFLLHSGLTELWGYHAVPVKKSAPGGRSHAKDEAETVSFFLRRLDEHAASGAPFLGIYYSFIAHWPYPDYGPDTHVMNPTRPLAAYYNDLHYLDRQIERIFTHLQEKQLLDKTIIVLVGDHGEAFGQHAHNYTHSRQSYSENLRTPAILYQPKLFPPRVVTAPTSHVDILPTLLQAEGLAYDPARLQGESLFLQHFRRRYIFAYGNEDTLTSVSADEKKLQVSLRDGSCWVYDLKNDPEEKRRLGCQGHAAQQQALLTYRRHQVSALRRYNQLSFQTFKTGQPQAAPAPAKKLALSGAK